MLFVELELAAGFCLLTNEAVGELDRVSQRSTDTVTVIAQQQPDESASSSAADALVAEYAALTAIGTACDSLHRSLQGQVGDSLFTGVDAPFGAGFNEAFGTQDQSNVGDHAAGNGSVGGVDGRGGVTLAIIYPHAWSMRSAAHSFRLLGDVSVVHNTAALRDWPPPVLANRQAAISWPGVFVCVCTVCSRAVLSF